MILSWILLGFSFTAMLGLHYWASTSTKPRLQKLATHIAPYVFGVAVFNFLFLRPELVNDIFANVAIFVTFSYLCVTFAEILIGSADEDALFADFQKAFFLFLAFALSLVACACLFGDTAIIVPLSTGAAHTAASLCITGLILNMTNSITIPVDKPASIAGQMKIHASTPVLIPSALSTLALIYTMIELHGAASVAAQWGGITLIISVLVLFLIQKYHDQPISAQTNNVRATVASITLMSTITLVFALIHGYS